MESKAGESRIFDIDLSDDQNSLYTVSKDKGVRIVNLRNKKSFITFQFFHAIQQIIMLNSEKASDLTIELRKMYLE